MLADSAKKHKNIVNAVIESKTLFRIFSILLSPSELAEFKLKPKRKDPGVALRIAYINLALVMTVAVGLNSMSTLSIGISWSELCVKTAHIGSEITSKPYDVDGYIQPN